MINVLLDIYQLWDALFLAFSDCSNFRDFSETGTHSEATHESLNQV